MNEFNSFLQQQTDYDEEDIKKLEWRTNSIASRHVYRGCGRRKRLK